MEAVILPCRPDHAAAADALRAQRGDAAGRRRVAALRRLHRHDRGQTGACERCLGMLFFGRSSEGRENAASAAS